MTRHIYSVGARLTAQFPTVKRCDIAVFDARVIAASTKKYFDHHRQCIDSLDYNKNTEQVRWASASASDLEKYIAGYQGCYREVAAMQVEQLLRAIEKEA